MHRLTSLASSITHGMYNFGSNGSAITFWVQGKESAFKSVVRTGAGQYTCTFKVPQSAVPIVLPNSTAFVPVIRAVTKTEVTLEVFDMNGANQDNVVNGEIYFRGEPGA